MTQTEYQGHRVRVRPDLLRLEPFIRGYLTDVQKRDGADATIIYAEFVSDQVSYILNIDNVPKLHRFKEKDFLSPKAPSHDTERETTVQGGDPAHWNAAKE